MRNKIETIDCRITNKMISEKVSFEGPLTWREIVKTQPEKEEVLRHWFNELGCWPVASSTPVYEFDTQTVYPSYSLDYPSSYDENGNTVGTAAYIHIRKAVIKGVTVNWNPNEVGYYPRYSNSCKGYFDAAIRLNKHRFVGCSDVSPAILSLALEKYKETKEEREKEKEKKNVLDEVMLELKKLEGKIKAIQAEQ